MDWSVECREWNEEADLTDVIRYAEGPGCWESHLVSGMFCLPSYGRLVSAWPILPVICRARCMPSTIPAACMTGKCVWYANRFEPELEQLRYVAICVGCRKGCERQWTRYCVIRVWASDQDLWLVKQKSHTRDQMNWIIKTLFIWKGWSWMLDDQVFMLYMEITFHMKIVIINVGEQVFHMKMV